MLFKNKLWKKSNNNIKLNNNKSVRLLLHEYKLDKYYKDITKYDNLYNIVSCCKKTLE